MALQGQLNGVTILTPNVSATQGRVAPSDATATAVVTLPTTTADVLVVLTITAAAAQAGQVWLETGATGGYGQVANVSTTTPLTVVRQFRKGTANINLKVQFGAAGGVVQYCYLTTV